MEHATTADTGVNNQIYDQLGELWYTGRDHPMALLRAQTPPLVEWVVGEAKAHFPARKARVLDLGCGAGLVANRLAQRGMVVTGLDASASSLAVAARHDQTASVRYVRGDACKLEFEDASFDVVTAMDLLEHIEQPAQLIREAARVLVPGGVFLFHTFNRNALAWLFVIKGVEWFVKNTPPRMHVLPLFLRPTEVAQMCDKYGLRRAALHGFGPVVCSRAFLRLLATGSVPPELRFQFQRSTRVSYVGAAVKDVV